VPAAPAAIAPSIATAPAAKPSPRVAAQAPATASAATPTRVPTLAELPPELRSQMPTLAVGGSVYSPQAASRIVILNGQVFREGDKPLDGLVVERIGLKSTLLVYRGTRFELKH
jgi:general secretion pathway protein B